jgi:hypothetical protein
MVATLNIEEMGDNTQILHILVVTCDICDRVFQTIFIVESYCPLKES